MLINPQWVMSLSHEMPCSHLPPASPTEVVWRD